MKQQCPWDNFEPATIEFCEERLCSIIAEPSNTWSNLFFLFSGIIILWNCRKNISDYTTMIGITTILVGINSFIFHMSGKWIGEYLDVSSMYLISGLFVTFNIRRLLYWSNLKLTIFYATFTTFFMILLWNFRSYGIWMFVLQVAIAGVLEIRLHRKHGAGVDHKYLRLFIITFILGFSSWILDVRKIVCDPQNHFITGHAIWHFCNSLVLYYYYKFHKQFAAHPNQAVQ